MSLLNVKNLQVAYGGIQAVRGIDLQIEEGELVTLIGANGAGKTTTLKTLVGMVKKSGGSIEFDGKDSAGIHAHDFVRHGLVMVPEGRGIFGKLTVEENLLMGAFSRNDKAQIQVELVRIYDLFPRLKERQKQLAGTLSGGEQQMVAMGRALMARPKLLCMDEPSMGLAPALVEQVFEIIQAINKQGTSIFMVEQNANMALSIADYGYVLQTGEVVLHGSARSLRDNELVQQAYLGEMQI